MAGTTRSELAAAMSACRAAWIGIGILSGILNVLTLTGSFYMLLIYDRVLPSHSVPTLIGLSMLALILYSAQGMIDLIRGRLTVRIGLWVDEAVSGRVYDALIRLPMKAGSQGDGLQSLRDLDNVRSFLSGLGPSALFDLPWMLVYLVICFAFHVLIGTVALAGAIVLVILTLITEAKTREPNRAVTADAMVRNGWAERTRRTAEVIASMGMARRMGVLWGEANAKYMESQRRLADVIGGLGAFAKVFRMMLQSAILGLGAYLVVHQEATGGIIIAASILTARALAPIDLAIANWRGFVASRQSWDRLSKLLALLPVSTPPMVLPAPRNSLAVEEASVVPPGDQRVVVHQVSFALKSGAGLGVIGPSASGKSSLARVIVGAWQPAGGRIRIDGASLDQWDPDELGRHIGYLPQDVGLLSGTVAQNIARFDTSLQANDIISAAKAAGVHDLILRLRDGYETQIGEHGSLLSAGQRQRIALARALYLDPFLVVLDEPNSNLDAEGEEALTGAILGVRARGGVALVIAHRPSALAGVDQVLVMAQGRVQAFGPKDEVLSRAVRLAARPLKLEPAA
jgi:PrtD family type I secretion system ABC transporter